MASGRINGSVASTHGAYSYYIKWSSTPNTAGNYSTVNVKTYYETSNTNWDFDTQFNRDCSITCDGQYRHITKVINCYGWKNGNPYLIQEENFTVYHNADGNKTITISAYTDGTAGSWGPDASNASGNAKLDFIPRESKISNVSGVIGNTVNINISKAYSGFTSTIKVDGAVIANKTSASSVAYTIPNSYYSKIPNSTSGTVGISCDTYNGGTLIGTSKATLTYRVNEGASKPTINPSVVDVNSTTVALTGNSGKLVRYLSTARAAVNSSAKNSASISSNWIKNGNTEVYAGSKDFANVSSNSFSFWTKDSRGYTNEKTLTPAMVDYIKLTCELDVSINPANGEATIKISGNAFNGSFGAVNNSIKDISYQWKEEGGNWQAWQYPSEPGISGDRYSTTILAGGFNYKKKYYFKAWVKDAAMEVYSKDLYVDNAPIANWGKNYFKFNVPVQGIDNVKNATSAVSAGAVRDCDNGEHIRLTYQPSYSASQSPYICTMMRNSAASNAPELRTSTASEVAKMVKPHLNIPTVDIPTIVADVPKRVSVSGWDEGWKFPSGLMIIRYWSYEYSNFHAWGNGYEMELTNISKRAVPSGTFIGNPAWFLGASSYYNEMTPNGWYPEMEAGTATQAPACFAVRPKSGSSGNAIGYCLMGIGRWK